MSDIAIRVENLSKQYPIGRAQQRHDTLRDAIVSTFKRSNVPRSNEMIWALKDVSFEVKRGEVLGIIGRNGAGKTTLLKILSRITEPTEGRAEIHGRVGSLLEVGTGFHPELTGRENIYLSGAILGMRRAEIDRKFDEIVDFSGVEKFIDTPIKRYSSGMNVRLGFAVAAHLEPEILLVDEVLAVGDVSFQKKCLGKMGNVAKEGRTVLFVSHNMNAISRLCGCAFLVDCGRIIVDGESADVISSYLQMQHGQLNKVALDAWNSEHRRRKFFEEIRINGVSLPGELVLPTKGMLQCRIIGNACGTFLRHFRSGIHVATEEGVRVMSYGTPWSSIGDIHIDGRVTLTCTTDELPLVPGRYLISIGCSDDSGPVDWLDSVCRLTIMPDTGAAERLIPTYKTHGFYLTESSWELHVD